MQKENRNHILNLLIYSIFNQQSKYYGVIWGYTTESMNHQLIVKVEQLMHQLLYTLAILWIFQTPKEYWVHHDGPRNLLVFDKSIKFEIIFTIVNICKYIFPSYDPSLV